MHAPGIGRVARVFAPLTGLVLFLSSCGAQQHPAAPALLRVIAEPDSARVLVDDRDVGSARVLSARPHRTRPGAHQISLTADGFFPHDLELELPRGETTLRIQLRPVPR